MLAVVAVGCFASPVPPEARVLREKISETESKLKDFEAKLKAASHDVGLTQQMEERKALTQSRLTRLKIRLHQLDPSYRLPKDDARASNSH